MPRTSAWGASRDSSALCSLLAAFNIVYSFCSLWAPSYKLPIHHSCDQLDSVLWPPSAYTPTDKSIVLWRANVPTAGCSEVAAL